MNDKPKFTPGPWGDYGSVDQTLFIMAEKDVDLRIAKVDCHFPEYNKANARLIAKAPEMYDSLWDLLELLYLDCPDEHGLTEKTDKAKKLLEEING